VPARVEYLVNLLFAHVFGSHFTEFVFQLFIAERIVAVTMRHINALVKAPAILGNDFRSTLKST
jgi:hypothetical protein